MSIGASAPRRRPVRKIMRTSTRTLLLWLVTVCLLLTGTTSPASASPTDAAFDQAAGALNVDRAAYLSKHDIVYNRPNTNPLYGMTVGNGRTGAMVWNQNGL